MLMGVVMSMLPNLYPICPLTAQRWLHRNTSKRAGLFSAGDQDKHVKFLVQVVQRPLCYPLFKTSDNAWRFPRHGSDEEHPVLKPQHSPQHLIPFGQPMKFLLSSLSRHHPKLSSVMELVPCHDAAGGLGCFLTTPFFPVHGHASLGDFATAPVCFSHGNFSGPDTLS